MASEEDEVRALLMRHRKQIIRDVNESELITVVSQKGVLTAINLKQLNDIQLDKLENIGLNNGLTPIIKNLTDTTYGCINSGGNIGAGDTNNCNEIDVDDKKCSFLIDVIARNGFEKFKEFCYAIESECPQLIGDLINDRLNGVADATDAKIETKPEEIKAEEKPTATVAAAGDAVPEPTDK